MGQRINQILDWLSDFLAHRKGLLPIMGILLIALNFILQFVPLAGWLAQTNLMLHVGIIVAIIGVLLAWAL